MQLLSVVDGCKQSHLLIEKQLVTGPVLFGERCYFVWQPFLDDSDQLQGTPLGDLVASNCHDI